MIREWIGEEEDIRGPTLAKQRRLGSGDRVWRKI